MTSTSFRHFDVTVIFDNLELPFAGDPKFEIRSVPGKGRGIIATRPITRGEEILSEVPLFTLERKPSQKTIAYSLASKTNDEKRQYLDLANCHREKKPLVGIFHTNILPCGDSGGLLGGMATKWGIFLQGCKFNSSCVPNVNNCWDEEKGVIRFHALRDITEGEELCICYGDLLTSRAMRRQWQEGFGFECHCPACSLPSHEQSASDNRRLTVKTLFSEIGGCGNRPAEGIKKVKTALRLLKEEGIVIYEGSFSYDAFQFCVAASDVVHAKAWITKAWKACCKSNGPDADQSKIYRGYMKKPKEHRLWGASQKMVLEGPDE